LLSNPEMPEMIQSAIANRPEEISAEGDVRVHRVSPTPELHHDVLGNLLGGVRVVQQGGRDPHQDGVPRAKRGIVRSFVARLNAVQERSLVHAWRR
jgi:hypothetical protein